MCSFVLGAYMSVKSQHLRLVDDVSEFHHTVWRSGQSLVVKKDSVLPDYCVKCGAPADGKSVNKWLFWHTPILLPVALLSWPFYLLLAMGMRKTMTVPMPLCSKHMALRTWFTAFGVALLPIAVVTLLAALTQSIPLLILLAMLMVISSAVIIGWVRNPVWVIRFEEDVAWVQNVHPSVLERESIPVWEEQDGSW